jgi:hypothetical protein
MEHYFETWQGKRGAWYKERLEEALAQSVTDPSTDAEGPPALGRFEWCRRSHLHFLPPALASAGCEVPTLKIERVVKIPYSMV